MINGRTKRMGKNICRSLPPPRAGTRSSWFIQAQIGSCLAIYKYRKMRPGRDWALSGVGRGSQYLDMPYSSGNNFNYFCFMDQQTESHKQTHTHHSLTYTHTAHSHTLAHTLAIWNKMAKISARHSIHKQMINLKRTTKI